MDIKRVLTAVIGFPLVMITLIFGNKYIIDVIIAIMGIIAMHEYTKCAANKDIKIVSWIGYLVVASISLIHWVPIENFGLPNIVSFGMPILLLILFLHVIITDMKITLKDITFSLIGILYLFSFLIFIPLLFGREGDLSGRYLIWYVLFSAWGTDVFAYLIGKRIGKTKFSKVSPNKSIEGCLAGTIGAVVSCLIYTFAINYICGFEISYLVIGIIALILSIIGQVGDFSASVIKRYFEVKDFSNLFPGHGGMIDRIDSVMFIAPFAYILFLMFL